LHFASHWHGMRVFRFALFEASCLGVLASVHEQL
jgi:hypothetical protein